MEKCLKLLSLKKNNPIAPILLQKAVDLLRAGELVAFPTETVYGLGADATNDRAVAKIFATKGRPQFNPLIVHVDSVAMAQRYAVWNAWAEALALAFCPAPLTMILPKLPDSAISHLCCAGGDTVGIRIPNHKDARELIRRSGLPLAAPSANRSGRISPTSAQDVWEELGDSIPLILDGGNCQIGIESTVIDVSGKVPCILRHGFITQSQIEAVLQQPLAKPVLVEGEYKSPGLLTSHYAPTLPLRLNVTHCEANEGLLAFGTPVVKGAGVMLNLSESSNLQEAAAHLFGYLRKLDANPQLKGISVMPIPQEGIGMAINDRLQRAATR